MELNISKAKRRVFSAFTALFVSLMCFGIGASAVSWNSLSSDVATLTVKKDRWHDYLYNAEFWLLSHICELVDQFDNAITKLLKINLYSLIKDVFNIKNDIYPIAGAVAGVALLIATILFMLRADKAQISDYLRGILCSLLLIAALPSIVSALTDLKTVGVKAAQELDGSNVTVDDDTMIVHKETLGSKILAKNIIKVGESLNDNKIHTFADSDEYKSNPQSVYKISPTGVLDNTEYDKVFDGVKTADTIYQVPYSSFSTYDKLQLLDSLTGDTNGIANTFAEWSNKGDNDLYVEGDVYAIQYTDDEGRVSYAENDHYNGAIYVKKGGKINALSTAYILGSKANDDGTWYAHSVCPEDTGYIDEMHKYMYVYSYERLLLLRLASTMANPNVQSVLNEMGGSYTVSDANKLVGYSSSFEDALSKIETKKYTVKIGKTKKKLSIFEYLVYKQNLYNVENDVKQDDTGDWEDSDWSTFNVIDNTDYENLDFFEQNIRKYVNGYTLDYMYGYNFRNFFYGFLLGVVTLIALTFAGFKIASLMFDVLFAQIVAPIAIASDMSGGGRAKQVIQNLIACNICFIAVIFILRLYLLVMYAAFDKNYGILVTIFLILAGAKFVIDGPDLIVKLTGMDAGVKSGLATIMGVRTAAQMASRPAAMAVGAGKKAGSMAANGAAGTVSGGIKGMVNGIKDGHGVAGKAAGAIYGAASGSVMGGLSGTFGNKNEGATGFSRGMNAADRATGWMSKKTDNNSDNEGASSGATRSAGSRGSTSSSTASSSYSGDSTSSSGGYSHGDTQASSESGSYNAESTSAAAATSYDESRSSGYSTDSSSQRSYSSSESNASSSQSESYSGTAKSENSHSSGTTYAENSSSRPSMQNVFRSSGTVSRSSGSNSNAATAASNNLPVGRNGVENTSVSSAKGFTRRGSSEESWNKQESRRESNTVSWAEQERRSEKNRKDKF